MLLAANAFIIYFAIGVPFALLTVFVNRRRLEFPDVARSLANLTLWPLIAIRSGYEKVVPSASFEPNGDLIHLRNRFNDVTADRIPKQVKREMIFEFERFEALSFELEALKTSSATPRPKILNAVRHPSPLIAANCHLRRNLSILLQYQKQSAESLRLLLNGAQIEDEDLSFELSAYLRAAVLTLESR